MGGPTLPTECRLLGGGVMPCSALGVSEWLCTASQPASQLTTQSLAAEGRAVADSARGLGISPVPLEYRGSK
jgi:hypothetical protein